MSCVPDKEIKALYSNRPCPQTIVMETHSTYSQNETPLVETTPVAKKDKLDLETTIQFEKKELVDCPYTPSLALYKWETSVYFDYNKYDLTPSEQTKLQTNMKMLNDQQYLRISIRGFTDSRGDHEYNQHLAENRVQSVSHYLFEHHISEDRIVIAPVGETAPLLPNSSDENMAVNRRVEMMILNSENQPLSYIIVTPDIQQLLDQKQTKQLFCKIWGNRIQWFPGVLFHSNQQDIKEIEMKKLQQNVQVLKNYPNFMVSIREFISPDQLIDASDKFANKRIHYIKNYLYDEHIETNRVQVVPSEETLIYKKQMTRSDSQQLPCVEMFLIDHNARPLSLLIVIDTKAILRAHN